MDDVEGVLCATCKSIFETYNKGRRDKDISHHQSYSDLVQSQNSGCFICAWILSRHALRSQEGLAGDARGQFSVTCDIFTRNGDEVKYQAKAECLVTFRIACSATACYDLSVYLSKSEHHWALSHDLMARPWSKLESYIGSGQSLDCIRNWVSSCEKNHKYCGCPSNTGNFFPARAIDVQEVGHGIVFLRDRDEVISHYSTGYPTYWTLSHRWGDPSKVYKLCTNTEHQLRGGISLDTLSPTFRDAALLVHRLGYKYLWIDSLCIFQDSESDWQREASTMVDIYRHSFCNISAISPCVHPSLGGISHCRADNMRLLYPFIINVEIRVPTGWKPLAESSELCDGPWIVWNDSVWIDEIERAPLHTRGWVAQERFLSNRILYFTRNQIYWECFGGSLCESDIMLRLVNSGKGLRRASEDYIDRKIDFGYRAARQMIFIIKARHTEIPIHPFFWRTLLSTYSSCTLTKDSDKLVALSGIAKAFKGAKCNVYLAGLWKDSIYYDLLWKTKAGKGSLIRRNTSYAPSWSWASVATRETGSGFELCFIEWDSIAQPLLRVTDQRIVTEPPGGDNTGILRSAELDIECKLLYFRWMRTLETFEAYTDEGKTQCYGKFIARALDVLFDISDQAERYAEAEIIEGMCILVCLVDDRLSSDWTLYVLILDHTQGKMFQRTGIIKCLYNYDRGEPLNTDISSNERKNSYEEYQARWEEWDLDSWTGLSQITLL
ncbi:HET-domain-containing protein [Daldinia eschscholtzii]|nr:HET-domain-containing protein [Daldinia eschscholtzii]